MGQHLSAAEALNVGIVNEVLPREQVLERAYEIAHTSNHVAWPFTWKCPLRPGKTRGWAHSPLSSPRLGVLWRSARIQLAGTSRLLGIDRHFEFSQGDQELEIPASGYP
ncbi:hypothetical protein [Nocardia australiensis]|uniref:hypothetical protein n=1 Tax=Nocardia australiensis TaxID=2887191 RepID=UPI00355771B3